MSSETPQNTANGHPDERPWAAPEPGRLVGRGHGPGDILEAWRWDLLEHGPGLVVVRAHLPEQLKNPQGQLFGGFTTSYVDFVSLHTVHSVDQHSVDQHSVDQHSVDQDGHDGAPRAWLTTINMRCDYFEPIMGPHFEIRGELVNRRGLTHLVSTRFFNGETMLAHGLTTLRKVPDQH